MWNLGEMLVVLTLCCATLINSQESTGTDTGDMHVGECKFPTHPLTMWSSAERQNFWQLSPLLGKSFSVKDDDLPKESDPNTYSYSLGICSVPPEAQNPGEVSLTAAYQHDEKNDKSHTIGRLNNTHYMFGTDWVMLEYRDGDAYHSDCNNEARRTILMIICSPYETEGVLRIIEENNRKNNACFYLFELEHNSVCTNQKSGLSIGSIVCIVFVSLVAVYLIGGFFYKRFVVGAKGIEQIPNLHFWKDFGNLQADGCDLICRCGYPKSTRSYRGVGDDQLSSGTHEHEPLADDSLLPM